MIAPQRYRKRPVEIEAMPLTPETFEAVWKWITRSGGKAEWNSTLSLGVDTDTDTEYLAIRTLEGVMRAKAGDWVIRGVEGEFYPCRGDIFRKTYEQVAA